VSSDLDELYREMAAAAEALDFDRARVLRDRIALLRGGAASNAVERADTSGLTRQQPGRMGLGTSQQQVTPPEGWKPPRKPDLMTSGRSRRRSR
jgi:hypothetical protein